MKKKKDGWTRKIDHYLYKNSYLYKWGKQLLRSRLGRILIMVAIGVFIVNRGYLYFKNNQVKQFLVTWQKYQNNNQYPEFKKCLDLSPGNPDRVSFPEWKEQFFDHPIRLRLSGISISRLESGLYKAEMEVIFFVQNKPANRFKGLIYVRENDSFKITRVEI